MRRCCKKGRCDCECTLHLYGWVRPLIVHSDRVVENHFIHNLSHMSTHAHTDLERAVLALQLLCSRLSAEYDLVIPFLRFNNAVGMKRFVTRYSNIHTLLLHFNNTTTTLLSCRLNQHLLLTHLFGDHLTLLLVSSPANPRYSR